MLSSFSFIFLLNSFILATYVSPTPLPPPPPPPTTTTPTPTSILTRPKLSSPQISSNSLQYQYQREEREKQQEQQEQHQAALTQTTLARLKKLNLKNYAAPRGYALPSKGLSSSLETPELKLTAASPTTPTAAPVLEMSSPTLSVDSTDTASTDSTPLQTPTREDSDEDSEVVVVGGSLKKPGLVGEERRWSLGMENGHFTSVMMMSSSSSTPRSGSVTPTPSAAIPTQGKTQTRTYPITGGVEMGTSPPFSDLEESVIGGGGRKGGSVYWDWGSAGAAVLGGGGGEVRKEVPLTSSPSVATGGGGGVGGLMPPQRRRPQRASGLSTAGNGSGSGSGSSDSAAGSKAPSTLAFPTFPTNVTSTTSTTAAVSPLPKQKPTPPKINLPARPPMGVPSSAYPGSPRRYLAQQQPQPPPPQRNGHRHYPPPTSTPPIHGGGVTPVSSPSDAIYQALVREWCFAQGPGPVVSSISTTTATTGGGSGETTPVVGLGRLMVPLSEGE